MKMTRTLVVFFLAAVHAADVSSPSTSSSTATTRTTEQLVDPRCVDCIGGCLLDGVCTFSFSSTLGGNYDNSFCSIGYLENLTPCPSANASLRRQKEPQLETKTQNEVAAPTPEGEGRQLEQLALFFRNVGGLNFNTGGAPTNRRNLAAKPDVRKITSITSVSSARRLKEKFFPEDNAAEVFMCPQPVGLLMGMEFFCKANKVWRCWAPNKPGLLVSDCSAYGPGAYCEMGAPSHCAIKEADGSVTRFQTDPSQQVSLATAAHST